MAHILVVTGSIRPQSVNQKIVPIVANQLTAKGADVTIADLGGLNLPFFDAPFPPTAPEFTAEYESVKTWTKMVAEADGVIFVTPEYNHTMTPIQINAIDWIGKEWEQKPIALIGYGWTSGGSQAHATAREALGATLKAHVIDQQANLFFTKDLAPDGSVLDAEGVAQKIDAVIDDLLRTVLA